MENEKNINKKPDFGKFPLESFDKLEDYFKDLLSRLDNYENYVKYCTKFIISILNNRSLKN